MHRSLMATVGLALSTLLPFSASAAEKSELSLPPYESYELDNGLKVLLMEDHSLPWVVVDTWFEVGSYDDPPGASGFAHLFEHLMFMGTEAVPEGQFDGTMEAAGAANNASTGDDRTNYYEWGTANTLDLLLYLEADRMTGLDITQEKLDLQRKVVRNERRQNYEDAPYGKIWLEIPDMLFPTEHPYHLSGIGSHEDLQNASLEHVTQFYADWYVPNNASLVVVGDFETEAVKAKIEALYGHLKRGVIPPHAPHPEVTEPVTKRRTVTDQVQLPAVVFAWHSPQFMKAGDAGMDVLASALSDGADSRLVQRLVHEESLAQEVSFFQASAMKGSMFVGMIIASPGADLAEIERIVNEETAAIASGEKALSERELTQIRNGLEMGLLRSIETMMGKAEKVQNYILHTGKPDYLSEDVARYRSVTSDEVSQLTGTYITPEKAAILHVLPATGDE